MTVWNDILAQVENLKQVVQRHAQGPHTDLERAAEILARGDRVIYTGVGSGLNATLPAYYYLMGAGHPAQVLDATEAAYGMLPGMRKAALVLNTRSGETAELIKLAQQARQAGIPIVAVTNEPGSTVGQLADAIVPTHSRWDQLVVISAYGGMAATELALAGQVSGRLDAVLADLKLAAGAIQDVLDQVIEAREAILDLFKAARPIYLLGRGASIASALAGELALEEMSRRPAVAMATGLFRQGPLEVVDDRFRAVMFAGSGEAARLNLQLARDLIRHGAGLAWVGSTPLEGALNITLPDLPGPILPLLEAVPGYVLAHDLARYQGIEPGRVRFIQKVITGEEGIPNQGKEGQDPPDECEAGFVKIISSAL